MHDPRPNPFTKELLAQETLQEWQRLIDTAAEIFAVPAGLITRVDGDQIEILLSSETKDNPYAAGYVAPYPDSGWYCERTLRSRGLNHIPDALADPDWKDNPAATGMHIVSYVGLPIRRPDGGEFGTVCFLDNKANRHNELHIKMLGMIQRMIELSLRVIFDKQQLLRHERLLKNLSQIYPICSYCKRVRDDSGAWVAVEDYIRDVTGTHASHGICPECFTKIEHQWSGPGSLPKPGPSTP
jgi:hypothetical protein